MRSIKFLLIILGIVFSIGVIYFLGASKSGNEQDNKLEYQSQIDEQGGITFTVKPIYLKDQTKFEISIDTHSGSLDFDLVKISALEDDRGNKNEPVSWEGQAPGGHHLSGTLVFPELDKGARSVELTIQDNYSRVFEWALK